MANIDYNKGRSLISRTPMKESEMSSDRQYHRASVRKADMAKKMIDNPGKLQKGKDSIKNVGAGRPLGKLSKDQRA